MPTEVCDRITHSPQLAERRFAGPGISSHRSDTWVGARPSSTACVVTHNLYTTRCQWKHRTQCRTFSTTRRNALQHSCIVIQWRDRNAGKLAENRITVLNYSARLAKRPTHRQAADVLRSLERDPLSAYGRNERST